MQKNNDFFSFVGEELYNIKNSRFNKIGQTKRNTNQSGQLSYDPTRLFKPQVANQMEKDYVQMKNAEEDRVHQIEFQLLKRDINLEYKKKVQESNLLPTHKYTQPYTLFGVHRASCSVCNLCPQYEGNFNFVSLNHNKNQTEFMECVKCGCPMNSHVKSNIPNSYKDTIWKHLEIKSIQDHHLNSNHLVVVLKIKASERQDIYNVIELLSELRFITEEVRQTTKTTIQMTLIKCKVLCDGVQKNYIESLLNLLEYIEAQQDWSWVKQTHVNEDVREQYLTIKRIFSTLNVFIKEEEKVFTLLLNSGGQPRFNEIGNMFKAIGERIAPFSFVWNSKSNKESMLMAQLLFRKRFELNYSIFLVPSGSDGEFVKRSQRLKDVLDYNRYIVMVQNIKNVERVVVEKALQHLSYSKLTYILGEQILSKTISRVGIKVAFSIGKPHFTIPFNKCPDYIQTNDPQQCHLMMTHLYPNFTYSQRCVIIIRPFFITFNYQEIIVNLLRVNNFILLKRVKIKLDSSQARYLSVLEHIDENRVQQYINWMCAGVSQVILVSKRAAIYQAHAICHGCLDGPSNISTKLFRSAPVVEIKRGQETFQYQLEGSNIGKNSRIFESVRELVKIDKVLFGISPEIRLAKNIRTGQYLKVEEDIKEQKVLKMGQKTCEAILKSLKNDNFNYWAYSSKSQTITEQLASIFMPQSTMFQSIIVILKPMYTHLANLVSNALIEHRYHIIMQKTVVLSKLLASEIVLGLQKVKMKKEKVKEIIEMYSSQKIHLYCISKVSAKSQMISMLSEFTFLSQKNIVEKYISDATLKEILVPGWKCVDTLLGILSHSLANLEESIKNMDRANLGPQDQLDVLNYMVGSTFGVSIKDLSMKSSIGQLSYYLTTFNVAKLQSWYYSQISNQFPNYVPLLFQYRQIGTTTICIQTYNGFPFLSIITQQYLKEAEKLQVNNYQKRRSMVLFLWAKKLSEVLLGLSAKTTQMKGFGEIIWINGSYRGEKSIDDCIRTDLEMIDYVQKKLANTVSRQVIKNIAKVRDSRILKARYEQSNKRILPRFTEQPIEQAFRIAETQQASKLNLIDQYQMIDPENQKNNITDLFSLYLFNITPFINTKYATIAEVYYFLIKCFHQALDNNQIYKQLGSMLIQFLVSKVDVETLQFQMYLKYLEGYMKGEEWVKPLLRNYPNLRKEVQARGDEGEGKKRKFIEQKQYFKGSSVDPEEIESNLQKYRNFNLNQMRQKLQGNVLFNPKDPVHQRWAYPERTVNLLREGEYKPVKKGIYVQFDKKTSENQQLLLNKIKNQVDRINLAKEDQIIKQNGLEDQLWYRRVKNSKTVPKQSKTDQAIFKQIGKLLVYQENKQKQINHP